jgi:hypothetical protein
MIWTGVIVAVAVAAAMAGALAWAGPVDPVKARSSHARPTPTSGGLAILAGTCAGAAVEALAPGGGGAALGWMLALASALGFVGAADDLWDFDAGTKAAAQAVTAGGLVAIAGAVTVLPIAPGLALPVGSVLGALGSGLFVLVLLNAMNFMDGSNGLAPGVGGGVPGGTRGRGLLERRRGPGVGGAGGRGGGAGLPALEPERAGVPGRRGGAVHRGPDRGHRAAAGQHGGGDALPGRVHRCCRC